MRKRSERQLPLEFSHPLEITRKYFGRYYEIHNILEGCPKIIDLVHQDLIEGEQNKLHHNVLGVSSETILRLILIQKIEGYSDRELIIRVSDSDHFRFFAKIYDDTPPDYSTFSKLKNLIQPQTWETINVELVQRAIQKKKKVLADEIRTDTTLVETNIAYPTDSRLLCTLYLVLIRLLRSAHLLEPMLVGPFRFREKDVRRLARKIDYHGRKKTHKSTLKFWFRSLIEKDEKVLTQAEAVLEKLISFLRDKPCDEREKVKLQWIILDLQKYIDLGRKVISQARRRVLENQVVPNEEKVFSLFEPHTELIIRGKADKPVEFGHMINLVQTKGGLIEQYEVFPKKPLEPDLLLPILEKHNILFGKYPQVLAADKGFSKAENLAEIKKLGIKTVAIQKKGHKTVEETEYEYTSKFKAALAFRSGIEGAISYLKRTFGLDRCLAEGWARFRSWVGAGVLAYNLVILTRL